MAENMWEIMLTIKKRVKENSTGLMAESTKVDGRTENNMVLEHIPLLVEKQSRENGKKARDFIGFRTNDENNILKF